MDQSTRFLLISLVIAVAVSVTATYWVTMHKQDFVIINDLDEEEMSSDEVEVESTI